MSTLTQLYNALPTVEDADARFQDREALFEKLAPLLAQYGNQFGVCLIHAHCSIDEGEKMIAKEYVSEPLRDTLCYPERWLAWGEAYEFNINPTQSPPAGLLDAFRAIIGDMETLGLYYVGEEVDGVLLERTEGRKNVTELVQVDEISNENNIATAWLPGKGPNPLQMACTIICHNLVTRTGGKRHRGGQIHVWPRVLTPK